LYGNGFPVSNQDLAEKEVYDAGMGASKSSREVRSEARGPHWVAWIPDSNGKPSGSVVIVGKSREEAEERARQWGDLQAAG
jgi:hypothetical protein